METTKQVTWQHIYVTSPSMELPVRVVAARGVPYGPDSNRLQSLNLYLPPTQDNLELVGKPVTSLPKAEEPHSLPKYHVHIHGGAWRDPHLSAQSVEPTAALAFKHGESVEGIEGIIGLNYTLTKFPTHPDDPYEPEVSGHSDPAREAVHPRHVRDVLSGFARLQSFGLADHSYVLTSHSCGACIAFQAILQAPSAYGLEQMADAPVPAALVGLNGLYDLPALVHDLGSSHAALSADYRSMLTNAFGPDEASWKSASPAHFDRASLTMRSAEGKTPPLVLLDQSAEDQLVPMNQLEHLQENLFKVEGLAVVRGKRAVGYHALPWESGTILWQSVQDVLRMLQR